jgi:hypothetical protein
MSKRKCWGKYKGDKPVAILWNNCIIPENSKIVELYGTIGTSAAMRLLKSETSLNYDIVNVDYNGEFYAESHIADKVERLLRSII